MADDMMVEPATTTTITTKKPKETTTTTTTTEQSTTTTTTTQKVENKVVYASHPIYWPGHGDVPGGYSVMQSDRADEWIAAKFIRAASTKEIKSYYGV